MSETKGLTRQQMADRVAREFQDGWIVNLGVGIPTMCSNTDIGDLSITYHSENGVIGYGSVAAEGFEDLNLVNAGGQNITLKPGAAIVHHADSFGVIRGGHVDATVMGKALERDRRGRPLPVWQGCRLIAEGQVFLMNRQSEDSLDGRYFGPLPATTIVGEAAPLWTDEEQ